MQAVIPGLLSIGHDVVGVDNFARYGHVERPREYEFVEADLTDPRAVDNVLRGADGVIQAAATIYGVGGFHQRPASILSNDLSLHANVLRTASRLGIQRVVYVSSSMVYERVETFPAREEDVYQFGIPLTDYGLSKLVGERMSMAFWSEHGLEYTIWRPFNILSPSEHAEREIGVSHVFADYLEALVVRRENPLRILGDGEQIRCFTWIHDIASCIARYSFTEESRNEAFNLANPEAVTMKQLALKIFGKAKARGLYPGNVELEFTSLPAYENDVRRRIPDVHKARDVLGWTATHTLDHALDLCISETVARASVGT